MGLKPRANVRFYVVFPKLSYREPVGFYIRIHEIPDKTIQERQHFGAINDIKIL